MFRRLLIAFICCTAAVFAEETFLLVDDETGVVREALGDINKRVSPCSTFKIPLSLMGFDAGILIDEDNPEWPDREEYDHYLASWRGPQTPKSWMKNSCVWYSQVLAPLLGLESMQNYLSAFEYGNQDMSGGVARAWLSSSLKISPKEQAAFLRKFVMRELPVACYAEDMTKKILFIEKLENGWMLYGKTGSAAELGKFTLGWFVGWVEKNDHAYIFAYNIQNEEIVLGQRIPRVKQLLAGILKE